MAKAWPSIVTLGCLLFVAPRAHAETGTADVCGGSLSPIVPATLPANVPGIPVLGSAASLSLLAPDGTAVATELKTLPGEAYSILAIDEPLVADRTYTLQWPAPCGGPPWTRTFHTTAAVPMPTSLGTVVVGALDMSLADGPCDGFGRPTGSASRTVKLVVADDVAAFLPISDIDLIVDGAPMTSMAPGWGGYSTESAPLTTDITCFSYPRVQHVAIRMRIPNGPTLVTPIVDAELHCLDSGKCSAAPDASVDTGAVEDTGEVEDTASGEVDDAGHSEDAKPQETVKATCTTSMRPVSWSGLLAVLGVGLIAGARRRR